MNRIKPTPGARRPISRPAQAECPVTPGVRVLLLPALLAAALLTVPHQPLSAAETEGSRSLSEAGETDRTSAKSLPHPFSQDRSERASAETEEADDENGRARREREERRRGRIEGPDDMVVLDRLLTMPPEHLARIRRAIEQIEAMSPEEREALRDRLRDFRHIDPEERQKIRERWRAMSPEERRESIREMRERRWQDVFEQPKEAQKEKEESSPQEDE